MQLLGHRVQQAATALLEVSLSEQEEVRLYESDKGSRLLDLAVQTRSLLFVARPRKQQMLQRWWFPLPHTTESLASVATALGVAFLAMPLNLVVLIPLFALAPPLELAAKRELQRRCEAACRVAPVEYLSLDELLGF